MNKLLGLLAAMLFACATIANAQTTTETFETTAANSTTFTSLGTVFGIVSHNAALFDTYDSEASLYGWNGTAADSRFIDNSSFTSGTTMPNFSVKTQNASQFKLGSFWLYPSKANLTSLGSGGTVTITGKLAGATVFSASANSGFNTNAAVSNGYTKIDLATFGGQNNASQAIDEVLIVTSGNFEYVAVDAMTWTKNAAYTISTAVTPGAGGSLTCTPNPVIAGGAATCTATANPGYQLNTIQGCGGSTATTSPFTTGAINTNCTVTATFAVALSAAITSTANVSCYQGSNGVAMVAASNGVPPYMYSWSPSGGTSAVAAGLAAGSYTVTVTDVRNAMVQRTAVISQPVSPLAMGPTSIMDGIVGAAYSQVFSATGGTPGYGYTWSNNVPGLTLSGATLSGAPTATGTYNPVAVTVMDVNGCSVPRNYAMQVRATVGGNVSGLETGASVTLANGADTVTVSNGAYVFPVALAQGASYSVTVPTQPTSPPHVCTVSGSGGGVIGSGNVTNANVTCQLVMHTVTVNVPSNGTLSCSSTQVPSGQTTTCTATPDNGFLLDTISGCGGSSQTSPWTTGAITADCTISASFVAVLSASMTQVTDPSCNAGGNGVLTVTPSGGMPPYTYLWSPSGGTGSTATGLAAGDYTVTVTDNRSNETQVSATLAEPPLLVLETVSLPDAINGALYQQTLMGSGGTPPLSWSVSQGTLPDGLVLSAAGELSGTATVSAASTLELTLSDSRSCGVNRAFQMQVRSTIGGTLAGLANGSSLTLANGADAVTMSADGPFTFPAPVASGESYAVTLATSPTAPPQVCGVANGAGVIGADNVSDVSVQCGGSLALGVSDGLDYADYMQPLTYLVSIDNNTGIDALGVHVLATLSPAFDLAATTWQCLSNGDQGVVCDAAQSSGALDDVATLPNGQTVQWLIQTVVDPASTATVADIEVSASYANPATDSNTLVIFRNGFDGSVDMFERLDPAHSTAILGADGSYAFAPATASTHLVDDVLSLRSKVGTLRVQRLNTRNAPWLRLHWLDSAHESAGAWVRASASTALTIGSVGDGHRRVILLEGENVSTQLALPTPSHENQN